jgi:hypothetical protein
MGRTYWFECGKCGYRAKVSGRSDRGLNFGVQTIACRDCRQLHDAVNRLRVPNESHELSLPLSLRRNPLELKNQTLTAPPSLDSALNRLPYKGVRSFKWVKFKPVCPVTAWHRVEEWKDPGKCPRCGLFLEKNAIPFRIWD